MTTVPAQKLRIFQEKLKKSKFTLKCRDPNQVLSITSQERYHAPKPTMLLRLTVLVLYTPLNTSLVER